MPDSGAPILMVRLGAMGDIIHALPAATSLRLSFSRRKLVWVAARRWLPLLDGNPHLDSVIPFDRNSVAALAASWKRLRAVRPDIAIDFQGLVQSALVGRASRPHEFIGLDPQLTREAGAAFFYSRRVHADGPHRVERCLQLARAAGATQFTEEAWIPAGKPEGQLPSSPFVLV
jgi:heptosyltransferase-1